MLIEPHHIRTALHSAKRFAIDTYHEGKKWAQTIDGYAQLFKRGLSAAAPLLNELGAGTALGHGVKAIQNFDTTRNNIVDLDTRGRDHLTRINEAIS